MAARKPKGGAQVAKGAPAKGKATKKATAAAKPTKGAKSAKKAKEPAAAREGSKTAQVVAMLQRKDGATLQEIMDKMGWQRHTVRGFMAGSMRKAGYAVESFKPEGESAPTASTRSAKLPWSTPARLRPRRAFSVVGAIARPLGELGHPAGIERTSRACGAAWLFLATSQFLS